MHNDLKIQPVTENDLLLWSSFWRDQWNGNKSLCRSNDVHYYRYRFLDNKFNKAVKCIYNGSIVGFFGIRESRDFTNEKMYISHEYVDVIFHSDYRQKGLFKPFFEMLIENSRQVDSVFIYPINREAFISWRLMLKKLNSHKIHRWHISLSDVKKEKPESGLSLREKKLDAVHDDYFKWRYADHPEQHELWLIESYKAEIGKIFFKSVLKSGKKIIEISSIILDASFDDEQLNELLGLIIWESEKVGFTGLVLRVLKDTVADTFFNSLDKGKTLEKLHALEINNSDKQIKNHLNSRIIIGEDLDLQREIRL